MCGFVGMISKSAVGGQLLHALQSIQHRGQDAAGLGTWDDRRVHLVKGLGLINQAVPAAEVPTLQGAAGIGHVRYPTVGATSTAEDAQPFRTRAPGILLAHNGNVTNMDELVGWLRSEGHVVLSSCDAEPILLTLTWALLQRRHVDHSLDDLVAAVGEVFARVKGAYSVTAVLELDGQPTLVAFRDPHGVRPGVYGQRATDGAWITASESVALDMLGVAKQGDIPPGGLLIMRPGAPLQTVDVAPARPRRCAFERVYFARPDSIMEEGRVNATRWKMGRELGRQLRAAGVEADVVVAVPDTSRPAAQAMAEELGIPMREGFIKNRYSGRTFIMPDARSRVETLRLKLNPMREVFAGKRVLLVDDSIVRGTTMGRIVEMVQGLGPTALHLAIFSPPVRHPCFYGIDMPSPRELVAAQYSEDALSAGIADKLGVDSLTFLSRARLGTVLGEHTCAACFDGAYPIPVSDRERAAIEQDRRG